ncbi:MAG: PAS domain S-box protein [Anaerolineales bacterium]|nr:PAS domain S-box protein [Anaerolineales bacterium]
MIPDLLSLKDSELRYRRLFEAAQDGILILDAKTGMIEDVNPYLIKMLGYSREEFIKKKLWEVGAFKDINASKDAFEALQQNEYIRYEDLPLKAKDGRLIQVEFVSNVYQAGSEKVIQCNIRDNTEHKRLILALQENEKKYFNLLNQSSDGIFIIDLAGNILTVNKAMCTELEFSEEEFLSMNIWDIIPEQYLDQYRERLTKILAGESFEQAGEYEVRGKNGKNHYVEVLSTPHYRGGDIVGFQGIARDISARKQAEQALQESEARNRRLVEHLPTVVYTNAVGDASSTLYVSPQIQTLLGYTPQEWLADTNLWEKSLHPEDRQYVLEQVAATNQTKKPFEMEYRMIARDGHLVWVHDQIVLMNELEGEGQLWQGIMLDITESKQAEQALQESEKRFRALVENNSDAITLLDANGIALYDSPAAPGMLGYAPEDWIGQDVFALIHPDDLPRMRDLFEKLVKIPGARDHSTFRLHHKSGSWLWIEMVTTNLLAEPGVNAIVLNYHNITERKQASDALRRSDERFRQVWETTSDAMALSDSQGIVLAANPAYFALYGCTADQVVGVSFARIFPQEQQQWALEQYRIAFTNEAIPPYFESVVQRADGKTRIVETRITFIYDASQRIAMLSTIQDITERKQVEEQVVSARAFLQGVQDALSAHIAILDEQGNIIQVNAAWRDFGVQNGLRHPDHCIGMNYIDVCDSATGDYANEASLVANAIRAVQTGEKNETRIEYPCHASHEKRWFIARITSFENSGRKWTVVAHENISNRKHEQEALRRLATIVETSNDGIIGKTLDGIITSWNHGAEKMYGYLASEVIGRSISLLFPPERVADLPSLLKSIQQGIPIQNLETQRIRKDGSRIDVSLVLSPIRNYAGELVGISTIARDITERKQAEERIQRQLEHLTAFREIDKAIAGSMNLRSVLQTVLEHVTTDLGVDAALILLYDPHAQVLKYELGKGFRTNALQFTSLRVGEGYAGRAVLGGQTIHIPNLQARTTDFLRSPIFYQEEFICYFGIPLMAKGEVKGVLEIFHRSALNPDEEKLNFMETMAKQVAIAIDNATLYKDIQRSNVELSMAYDATIEGWSHALDLRDKETEGHSQRVTKITVDLARDFGLSEEDLIQVRWGSLLHDIGKMGVPDSILLKPGALTEEEWVSMKNHPRFAYDLLSPIRYLRLALDIPYCHHEKWDGTGYPRGLKGEQIPLTARIFAVVDVWDALRSDRPYRAAWDEGKVREHIFALAGTHFDPLVVDKFLNAME